MKQIIQFKKDLPFKTKVSEITSISLEREIKIENDGIITGIFHITGDYKMNEGSINREKFSFELPFDITLDPRYDINSIIADVEDFYYDVENEDTLKVNIDLFVEAEYLSDSNKLIEENKEERKVPEELELPDKYQEEIPKEKDIFKEEIIEPTPVTITNDIFEEINQKPREKEELPSLAADLFSNLDSTETYTTYYVYVVKEEDTIDKILEKYKITKEELEAYNVIEEVKPGDKVIIPKTCGE